MADAIIEALQSCGCCLRPAPHRETDPPHTHREIYWTMLKECFNIQVISPSEECSICQKCIHRLIDASDFKLQVQRSQTELQERLRRPRPAIDEPEIKLEKDEDRMENDPLGIQQITPSFLKVIIKEEHPSEEADSSVADDQTGPYDREIPEPQFGDSSANDDPAGRCDGENCEGLENRAGEHFLLGGGEASTSSYGDQQDASATKHSTSKQGAKNGKKKHPCNICGKEFTFSGSLRRHIRLHNGEKRYPCEVCDKTFSQSCHLQEHKLIHTGVRPHTCPVCKRNFTHRNSLTQHVKLHVSRERPFVCGICKKDFARLGALRTHERIHTGEKPYVCDICYKAFTLPEGLRRHKFTHSNDKPFSCEICHKKFSDTGDLKRHTRTHTGEKPYSCDQCEKKFAQLSNLKQHKLIHTGDKPHECDICNRRFSKSSHLKVHKRIHSSVIDTDIPMVICKTETYEDESL